MENSINWSSRLAQKIPPDITFKFSGTDDSSTRVGAHKMILAMASDVFMNMFYVVDTADMSANEIIIEDTTAPAFSAMIDAVYGVKTMKESLEGKSLPEMFSVLYLVKKYNVTQLVVAVKEIISTVGLTEDFLEVAHEPFEYTAPTPHDDQSENRLLACIHKDNDKRLGGIDSCSSHDHPVLHGVKDLSAAIGRREAELKDLRIKLDEPMPNHEKVLCIIMEVKFVYGYLRDEATIVTLFDPGSNTSLILNSTALFYNLLSRPVTIKIDTVNGPDVKETNLYILELVNNEGERRIVKAYGVDRISDVITEVDFGDVKYKFSDQAQRNWDSISQRPHGKPIQLLVGSEKAALMPSRMESVDNLVVLSTEFGTGSTVYGHHKEIKAKGTDFPAQVQAMRRSGGRASNI